MQKNKNIEVPNVQKRKFQLKGQNFHLKNPLIENLFHSHRLQIM